MAAHLLVLLEEEEESCYQHALLIQFISNKMMWMEGSSSRVQDKG